MAHILAGMTARYEFALWKEEGETPLAALTRFKLAAPPQIAALPMTYAGRLDPLASGVLPVIAGDITEAAKQELLNTPKEYEVDILFGVSSDTDDPLGIVRFVGAAKDGEEELARTFIQGLGGPIVQDYPAYSSAVHDGLPLWQHAREGRFPEKQRESYVYKATAGATSSCSVAHIADEAARRIHSVSGDFRQEEVLASWEDVCARHSSQYVTIMPASLQVGSGFYVRALARMIGEQVGCGALAWRIVRTRVGRFGEGDAWRHGEDTEAFLGDIISS
jgi:tRNA pseudouridine55 synthase